MKQNEDDRFFFFNCEAFFSIWTLRSWTDVENPNIYRNSFLKIRLCQMLLDRFSSSQTVWQKGF